MQSPVQKAELVCYYGKKFRRVRVDRSRGIAPHKPILLLAVTEYIQRGYIAENKIYLVPSLIQTFLKYWVYLGSSNHNPDISKPFFYMKSGKFWHLWPKSGFEKILSSKQQLTTFAEVKRAIEYAYLDEDLFELIQEPSLCESLCRALTGRWFPGQWDLISQVSCMHPVSPETFAEIREYSKFYGRLNLEEGL